MNDILAKISSYQIFNNLVPGAVLVYLLASFDIYVIDARNVVVDLIVFYFAGMVISRIGSLIVEPLLKLTRFITYARYTDYIRASKIDPHIAVLLESNNQYRTFLSMMIVLLVAYICKFFAVRYAIQPETIRLFLVAFLFGLFFLAYRKQTNFIRQRVEHHTRPES